MGFTPEQVAMLKAPLDKAKVKTREQSGRSLSYIEGWHAIDEANRIFGFDGWDRETVYLKEVSRVEKNGKWKVGYEAKIRITVFAKINIEHGPAVITREGTGHGQGTMSDLFDCIESAAKEAETDAMKRALMTFGNPFGLALYDKEQRNVEDTAKRAANEREEQFANIYIDSFASMPNLQSLKAKFELGWKECPNYRERIKAAYDAAKVLINE